MPNRSFRGRGRVGISESQRRKKTWVGFGIAGNVINGFELKPASLVAAGGSISLVSFSAKGSFSLEESTLMRIRGSVQVPKSTPGPNSGTNDVSAFGIAMVTDDAASVGAVPNPATVLGADWDGWLFYRSNVSGVLDANGTIFDAKAMRKFTGGQSLVFVAGLASDFVSGVTAGITLVSCRGLFLLP